VSHIHIFIYFDDKNKIENELIIYLVKNKLEHVLDIKKTYQ